MWLNFTGTANDGNLITDSSGLPLTGHTTPKTYSRVSFEEDAIAEEPGQERDKRRSRYLPGSFFDVYKKRVGLQESDRETGPLPEASRCQGQVFIVVHIYGAIMHESHQG
jgi:hypothetical protein